MRKLNTEEFVEKSNKIHNSKYNYDKVNYINSRTKVIVTCPIHGDFEIRPSKHLYGQGCKRCGKEKAARKISINLSDVIKKCSKIHNNKYDYSLVVYKNQYSKIKIICPEHGTFEQTVKNHKIYKRGCPKCARQNNGGWTTEDWVRKCSNGKILKLYFIECWNEDEHFYKIGLTCKPRIEDRFHGVNKMPYKYKILHCETGEINYLVKLERSFKRSIIDCNDKYIPKLNFGGSTYECFKGRFFPTFENLT